MNINTQELLRQAKDETQEAIQVAKDSFGELTEEELYWQPAPDQWSVGECLEHLNITFRSYLPKLIKGIEGAKADSSVETFKTGFFGRMFTDTLQLDENNQPKRKVKTFKSMDAARLPERNTKVREEFTEYMETFLAQIEKAATVNLNKVKITSFIGPILRFRLGDLFRFVVAHNYRHLIQAQRVLKAMQEKTKVGQ